VGLDDGGGMTVGIQFTEIETKDKKKKVEERERIWCVMFLQNCPGFKVK
jgi:hypothetical protein